jgi:hypothetical protein
VGAVSYLTGASMSFRAMIACLALAATTAFAATPKPIPAPKATVSFTQAGVTRTLNATAPTACLGIYGTVIRAFVGPCGGGSYVQFPKTGGDVSVHWSTQDACGPKPADVHSHSGCPAGTKGNGWDQTATYAPAAPPQCWVLGPALPADPPNGACESVTPPPSGLTIDYSFVDRSSDEYAAFINQANRSDAEPDTLLPAYKMTGTLDYCVRAVNNFIQPWMSSPGQIADDSYLDVDGYLSAMSKAYAWCPNVTAAQKTQWAGVAVDELNRMWNSIGWSGWALDDMFNNYHYHFVRAQVYWALASGDPIQISFARQKIAEVQTALATISGGGSKEGTGYQYAYKHFQDTLLVWRDSGQGDLADAYTDNSVLYWIHATVPTLDVFAPIGSQPRDSEGHVYDYQRGAVGGGAHLSHSAAVKQQAAYWLGHIPLQQMFRLNAYDNLWTYTPTETKPPLVFRAAETGAVFARKAWGDPNACWAEALMGEYSQNHAHPEQGSFMLYCRGGWLTMPNTVNSHSGIQGEPPFYWARDKNVPVFVKGGQGQRQQNGRVNVTSFTSSANGSFTITGDLTGLYAASAGVSIFKRTIAYDAPGDTLTVTDNIAVSSGTSVRNQINTPVRPACSGNTCTAGALTFTVVQPANPQITMTDMTTVDPDYGGGWRINLLSCNSGCQFTMKPSQP